MPNISKATMTRIGRLLNPRKTGQLRTLAEFAAIQPRAVYNWTLDPADPQYRAMPAVAKRMVALLAYFGAAGLLDERRLEEIRHLEAALEQEKEVRVRLRRMDRAVSALNAAAQPEPGESAGDSASG